MTTTLYNFIYLFLTSVYDIHVIINISIVNKTVNEANHTVNLIKLAAISMEPK